MREVTPEELVVSSSLPFVRHQVDASLVTRAWVNGSAALWLGARPPLSMRSGSVAFGAGPPDELVPLVTEVAGSGIRPERVVVESSSVGSLPAHWRPRVCKVWHWMLTRRVPEERAAGVVEVSDPDAVNAVLDAANPDAFARPGLGGDTWLGVRSPDNSRLLGVGAVVRMPRGTGHLRAVTVLPEARGRGLGRDLSVELTLRALSSGSGVATIGVYTDNAPALAIYDRLGYVVQHTFAAFS